jgi:hypothetical protein
MFFSTDFTEKSFHRKKSPNASLPKSLLTERHLNERLLFQKIHLTERIFYRNVISPKTGKESFDRNSKLEKSLLTEISFFRKAN